MNKYSLAIDTSSSQGELALYKGKELKAHLWIDTTKTHAETLLERIDFIMKQSEVEWREIEKIIAVTGPGSFTGIRIGLSVVKTISYLKNIPISPLSALQIMAIKYYQDHDKSSECYCLIPGIRDELYIGFYGNEKGLLITKLEKLTDYEHLIIKEKVPIVIKDGISLRPHPFLSSENLFYSNLFLAHLSDIMGDPRIETVNHDQIEALYLRKSEAELNYLKKEERKYSLYIENLWGK